MITKTNAFQTSDEKQFPTLEEAQIHEIACLLPEEQDSLNWQRDVADKLLKQKDKLLDILTTGPRSKPKARKINGATRKRKVEPIVREAEEEP